MPCARSVAAGFAHTPVVRGLVSVLGRRRGAQSAASPQDDQSFGTATVSSATLLPHPTSAVRVCRSHEPSDPNLKRIPVGGSSEPLWARVPFQPWPRVVASTALWHSGGPRALRRIVRRSLVHMSEGSDTSIGASIGAKKSYDEVLAGWVPVCHTVRDAAGGSAWRIRRRFRGTRMGTDGFGDVPHEEPEDAS